MRCPNGAKFAVTSDTNSCITIKDETDVDDSLLDDSDDNDVDDNDPNMTMLIETPEVVFLCKRTA